MQHNLVDLIGLFQDNTFTQTFAFKFIASFIRHQYTRPLLTNQPPSIRPCFGPQTCNLIKQKREIEHEAGEEKE